MLKQLPTDLGETHGLPAFTATAARVTLASGSIVDNAYEQTERPMAVSRIFLAAIGFLYLALAAWCSLKPQETSEKVGFQLRPGSGQSEFLVIYGGLELGLALLFLLPLVRPEHLRSSLLSCLILHACLVAFRSVSFFLYSDILPMTRKLAFFEWLILICAAILFWLEMQRRPHGNGIA